MRSNNTFFYTNENEINDLINDGNVEFALYYWNQIDKLSKNIKNKEFARKQICNIDSLIKNYNKRVSDYNTQTNKINDILKDHKIINKEKSFKLKKVKLLNI